MVKSPSGSGSLPEGKPLQPGPANPLKAVGPNLYQNPNPDAEREVLDRLPVLVFLERAGKIVFANAEARRVLELTEGEWTPRPVEEVLWGLFPGTAEPQTLLTGTLHSSPFHATLPDQSGHLIPVEGTYGILRPELREAVIVAHPSDRERVPRSRLMESRRAPSAKPAINWRFWIESTRPPDSRSFPSTKPKSTGLPTWAFSRCCEKIPNWPTRAP